MADMGRTADLAEQVLAELMTLPVEEQGEWLVQVLGRLEGRMQAAGRGQEFEVLLGHIEGYLEDHLLRRLGL